MISPKIRLLLILGALLPLLVGCAWYNSYYNGKQSYRKGLKIEKEMTRLGEDSAEIYARTESHYQRAIEKAQKAISSYPKALKTHDDAYFLKGLASFKKEDFGAATFAFLELHKRYPNSKHIPESWLWLGKAYAYDEEYALAQEALEYLVVTYPKYADAQDVLMLRADIALNLKGKGEAIKILKRQLRSTTNPMRRLYIMDRLAGLYLELNQYDEAVAVLQGIPEFDRKQVQLFFSAEYRLAQAYYNLKQYVKVADLLAEMSENNSYFAHRDKLQLFAGKVYLEQKNFDEAEKLLLRLATGNGKNELRGEAWFLLSGISIDERGDLEKGLTQLEEALKLVQDLALRGKVSKRLEGLRRLAFMKDTLDSGDPDSTDMGLLRYKIGEVYWLDTRLPDSALIYFDKILADTTINDTLYASALYAKAWITKAFLKDTTASDSLFEDIVARYPDREVAKQSQIELGQEVTVVTRRDSAWLKFEVAEELSLQHSDYKKEVYYAYLVTYKKYSDIEDVAAKSLYAAGRTLNKRFHGDDGTLDTAAVKIFTRLCDEYPESPQCLEIQMLLSDEAVQGYAKTYIESRDADTSQFQSDTASVDTTNVELFQKSKSLLPPEIPNFDSWL